MQRWLRPGKIVDLLAVLAIAFVAYRLLVAPRFLALNGSHPAPHVTYATLAGPPFELARHRGHVVFLDFYATWCEPCKISLPWVEHFARAHPEVEVIPVDVGEPAGIASAFAKAHDMRNVALDPNAFSNGFFLINGFPTMVVIDPQNRVRATWEGLNPAIQLNMAHAEKELTKAS